MVKACEETSHTAAVTATRARLCLWIGFLLVLAGIALPLQANTVRLTWDPSPDPDVAGYILWYGTQSGVYTNATSVGDVVVASASNLVAGVTYYFVVTAHDGFGIESEPSNEVLYNVPITIPEPEPDATTRGYVTGIVLGTPRNDFTGFVGMQIVVGGSPITVTSLGRFKAPGNTGTHTVKLVRGSDGVDVTGGKVSLNMAGGVDGTFHYAQLTSPVALSTGAVYYVVSQETVGGDAWYEFDTTLTTTSVASHPSAIWGTGQGQWYTWGEPGQSYVPVDFQYALPSTNSGGSTPTNSTPGEVGYVTSVTPGTWRNDYSGFVGMNIVVGPEPLTVTSLGRMRLSGNIGAHLVKLVRASDGVDVPGGSVLVPLSTGTVGNFQYGRLSAPVVLSPNTGYYLVSQETAGADSWLEFNTTITKTSVAAHPSAVWGSGPGKWYRWGGPGQTYVPVDFLHTTGGSTGGSTGGTGGTGGTTPADASFITSVELGSMRNDFSGYVGLNIVIGAQPVTITSLGRMKFSGNSGSHSVKLVRASDGQDVSGATTVVNMSGGTVGQFSYGQLASPVVLPAGTSYYLLSQEVLGGDTWAEFNTTVTTTSVASIPSAAWGYGPGRFYPWGGPRNTYVPLDFKYTTAALPPEASLVTAQAVGAARNDFTGYVGMHLVVGSQPLTVTALGRFKLSGNTGKHQVKLVRASDGADVTGAAVTVDLASGNANEFQYARLSSPIILSPGTAYYLMSQETQGGDYWYEYDTQVTLTGVAVHPSAAWGYRQGQWYQWGGPGQSYVPVSFKYTTGQ